MKQWLNRVSIFDQLIVDLVLILGGLLGLTVCVMASIVDIREYRIPNRLVAFGFLALVILLAAAAILDRSWQSLIFGLTASMAFFVAYLLLAIIGSNGMGMGDVKLAAVVGLTLGPLGVGASIVGFYLAFVVGASFGMVRIALRRGSIKSHIPFAPFMTVGLLAGWLWFIFVGQ